MQYYQRQAERGRKRLRPSLFDLTIEDLEAILASHYLSLHKTTNEFDKI